MRPFLSIPVNGCINFEKTPEGLVGAYLVFHPSDFVEAPALACRYGHLGFRAIGSDGITGLTLSCNDEDLVLSAENGVGPRIRGLKLVTRNGKIKLDGVTTAPTQSLIEPDGYIKLVVNGENVKVPYYRETT